MLQAQLKVVGGKQDGKVIPLSKQKFLIGREEDCQLRPNSELVSRHHCVFTLDDYSLRLRDLGSTNGTLVNGERIRGQVMLNAGDTVSIGKLEFEVLLREASGAAAVPEPEIDQPVTDETTELSGSDTSYELPIPDFAQQSDGDEANVFGGDTTISMGGDTDVSGPVTAPQPPQEFPPPPALPTQPQPMYPGQAAMYPQMPYPQMPYPQMPYPQMPYPQMPYPQMPGMYPQPPGMYPQPPQMAPPAPNYEEPEQYEEPEDDRLKAPPVRLPDPSTTGAAPPEPKPEASADQKPAQSQGDGTNKAAAEIIRQYRQRRPDI